MFLPNLSANARDFVRSEVRRQPTFIAAFIALSVVAATLELSGLALVFPFLLIMVQPDYIQYFPIIETVTQSLGIDRRLEMYLFLVLLISGLTIAKNVFMGWFTYWQLQTISAWKARLSERLMKIYLFSDFSIHMRKTTSEIVRNVALVTLVYDWFFKSAIQIIVNVVMAIGLVFLLFFTLPSATVFGTAVLLGTAVAVYVGMRKLVEKIGIDSNVLHEQRQRLICQSIGAIKEAKILGKEGAFVQKFLKVEKSYFEKQSSANFLQSLPYFISETVVVLSLLTIVLFETAMAEERTVAIATLGLLAATMFRLAPQFNKALAGLQLMNMAKDSMEIVSTEIAENEPGLHVPEKNDGRCEGWEVLSFRNVRYSYPSTPDRFAVTNLNIDIARNDFIGITGPSGSGKSTLMMLLLGLLRPTEGQILLDDGELKTPESVRTWQNGIGYVPQSPFLIDGTLTDNIAYAADDEPIDEERIRRMVSMVQMDDHVEAHPDGIYCGVGEYGKRLSGGQQQRVVIARALYHNPDLVAFDEATSALDVSVERAVTDNLMKFKGKKTMVAIAHRLSTLRSCDRIIYMEAGQVVDFGSFEELEARCPAFRRLVDLSNPRAATAAAA
jgi:ATP-binding cassette subfamily C protein